MEDGPEGAAILVAYVVQHNAFPVIEAYPELPVLPLHQIPNHLQQV